MVKFVNRLSDTLFVLARTVEFNGVVKEIVDRVKEKLNLLETEQAESINEETCEKEYSLLTLAKKMAAAARVKAEESMSQLFFQWSIPVEI